MEEAEVRGERSEVWKSLVQGGVSSGCGPHRHPGPGSIKLPAVLNRRATARVIVPRVLSTLESRV